MDVEMDTGTTEKVNVNQLINSIQRFGVIDYIVFIAMLSVCSVIGIYFGIQHNKQQNNSKARRGSVELDFLVGGRKLSIFPVAMSLTATWISGITLLGTSTETYLFGTEIMVLIGGVLLAGICIHFFFLPVYVEMQLTSLYEYLEARFDKRMRLFGSVLFVINQITWIPIVVYVPALAFNQVTGFDIHIVTPAICFICMFYTGLGGIKAVVWTDLIQIIIMYGTIGVIIVKGTMDAGGLAEVWNRNYDSGRIEFPSFSLDPTIRHSVFSLILGGGMFWTAGSGVNQGLVQRYLSLPNIKAAKKSLWIFVAATSVMIFLCFYNGLLIYATYHDCDPLSTKLAKAKDQLVPLFIMDIFRNVPGLPGLFVSGIFSAALSSLSTGLNSLSAVILEDFVKPYVKTPLTGKQTDYVLRGVVVAVGVICVFLVFIVEKLGAVLQLSYSVGGVTIGPLFGVFVMGLTMPWVNKKSALIGGVTSLFVTGFVVFNAQALQASGHIVFPAKPVSTEGCTYHFENTTITTPQTIGEVSESKSIFHLSYMYNTLFSCLVTILVTHLAMLIVGRQNPDELDHDLLPPIIRRMVQSKDVLKSQLEKEFAKQNFETTHNFDHKNVVDNTIGELDETGSVVKENKL